MKGNKLVIYLICFFLLTYGANGQSTSWFDRISKIEPLTSTETTVIELFGLPSTDSSKFFPSYDIGVGIMNVEYSRGPCSGSGTGWNVPEYTVTRIFVDFRPALDPKHFPIGNRGFKKNRIVDSVDAYSFENDDLGISYDIKSTGMMEAAMFYPKRGQQSLLCKK